ncbi:MAG TPA: hypothetical protein ENN88_04260, partial [Candidatus Coatesbacteria bacterium]|nr:hypothetical protein [Candidatus Coatesbacteria bacterium]
MRVHELAKEFGVPSKLLIARMRSLGIEVSGHMASVNPEQEKLLRIKFQAQALADTSTEKPKARKARKPVSAEEKASARAASVGTKRTEDKPRVRVRHRPKAEEELLPTPGEVLDEAEETDEILTAPKVRLKGAARPKGKREAAPSAEEGKLIEPSKPSYAPGEPEVEEEPVPRPEKGPMPPTRRSLKRPDFEAQVEEERQASSRVLYRPEKPVTPEDLGLEASKQRPKTARRRRRRRRKSSSVMIHELRTSKKTRARPKAEAKK